MAMTPKEKAEELFMKIYQLDSRAWYDVAKKCALIAVDEIINTGALGSLLEEYYLQVKQEIEKL
jgi:hypothetical protein